MTTCPHCGRAVPAGVPLPPSNGMRVYCTACGQLAISDAGALGGLRAPTRAERNAAYSDPVQMAARAAWLRLHAPHKRANRVQRARAGSTLAEVLIIMAIILILLGIPVMSWWSCTDIGKAMRASVSWRPVTGCLIEHKPGEWVPLANYRIVPGS